MCGIYSLSSSKNNSFKTIETVEQSVLLSKKRGREASGIGWVVDGSIEVRKSIGIADWSSEISSVARSTSGPVTFFGQARMATNGAETNPLNNQPIVRGSVVLLHNGIILNDKELWEKYSGLERLGQVDSEILAARIDQEMKEGKSLESAVSSVMSEVEGTANIIVFSESSNSMVFASNHGSLYWVNAEGHTYVASEKSAVDFVSKRLFRHSAKVCETRRGELFSVSLETAEVERKTIEESKNGQNLVSAKSLSVGRILKIENPANESLKRCTRCVLPVSFPLIEFDEDGVCQFCRSGGKFSYKGQEALESLVAPYRRNDGRPDCLVALSGGRDSSFGLHYIKKELKLNPVAYTYDWGMVTDVARRNISRMCYELDVEHVLRSADISEKRRNVRKNLEGWLAQPDLGMIPLLMAGDKQFYYYAQQVSREYDLPLVMFCAGNPYEKTEFKTGFCGIEDHKGAVVTRLGFKQKLQIAVYYALRFLKNPKYWNRSLVDTLFAYYSTYVLKDQCAYLYEYIPFDEKEVDRILTENYKWELAADSDSSWRIGDGTACFYNYVYHTIAGFSEHDTFRSHQIRNGEITRDEALKRLAIDNRARWAAMEEYASMVGFNLNEAVKIINSQPKLY